MVIYENDEIYVRPIHEYDLKKNSYFQWFHDQEICKYNSHGKMSHAINYTEASFNHKNDIVWAVIKKKTKDTGKELINQDIHIGNVVLEINWINRNAEFTCIFGEKEYWGKGYCTQAMKWLFSHGFNKLNLHKIWLGTASLNKGMISAAKKVDMHTEGRLRGHLYINGAFSDIVQMAIFKKDFNVQL